MRSRTVLTTIALLAACGTKEAPKPAAPPPPPPAPTIADFAGTWNTSSMLTGQTKAVEAVMNGTAADTGWTLTFKDGPKVALTVSMSGDSLIAQSAEYKSVLRKGVTVSVRTANVVKDGKLSGNVVATYKTAKGPEVVNGTMTAEHPAPAAAKK